ncbi:hypothetical protein FHX42_001645 [Saccharopolyspora lacisalsi]|uniref:Uncharacterized protein n=1 Tax=Halosaccharopolyspora lacisalsi TaxID=1000566 RepID=A0A839E001_9PSEU|nr:hypothetical protein [Halosaccharopolyspora lacisalsi]
MAMLFVERECSHPLATGGDTDDLFAMIGGLFFR